MAAPDPRLRRPPLLRSFAVKLAAAAVIFAIVPGMIYSQLERTEQQRSALMLQLVQEQGRLVGEALTPLLDRFSPQEAPALEAAVRRLTEGTAAVKVLFRPAALQGAGSFLLVASAPETDAAQARQTMAQLVANGVLSHLDASCSGNTPLSLHLPPDATAPSGDLLTYLAPHRTAAGCWVVLTAQPTGSLPEQVIGRPYWQSPDLRVAASVYLLMAVLVLSLFTDAWRDLRRFRSVARAVMRGDGRASFSATGTVAELADVAADLDAMVSTLKRSEILLRQAAEENAHALKGPLAVIAQAAEPLGRAIPADNARAHRSLALIGQSVERLDALVSAIRRTDEAIAGLIDVPRQPVALSALLRDLAQGYTRLAAERSLRLDVALPPGITVTGSGDLLEVMAENLLDNALDFAPSGSALSLTLRRERGMAVFCVRDHGPGVAADDLDRIFDRHVSQRPGHSGGADHYGLGLWIVRRNAEALGGRAWAENAPGGGLAVSVALPLRQGRADG